MKIYILDVTRHVSLDLKYFTTFEKRRKEKSGLHYPQNQTFWCLVKYGNS